MAKEKQPRDGRGRFDHKAKNLKFGKKPVNRMPKEEDLTLAGRSDGFSLKAGYVNPSKPYRVVKERLIPPVDPQVAWTHKHHEDVLPTPTPNDPLSPFCQATEDMHTTINSLMTAISQLKEKIAPVLFPAAKELLPVGSLSNDERACLSPFNILMCEAKRRIDGLTEIVDDLRDRCSL